MTVYSGLFQVSNEPSLWRKIYQQMDIPVVPPSASHHIKMSYKKYDFYFPCLMWSYITHSSTQSLLSTILLQFKFTLLWTR